MSSSGPIESYLEGASVRVEATLFDFDNNVVNPTNVRLLVKAPSTTGSTVASTSISGNACIGFITASEPGTWRYRFETTTLPYIAHEGQFTVSRRRVPAP